MFKSKKERETGEIQRKRERQKQGDVQDKKRPGFTRNEK